MLNRWTRKRGNNLSSSLDGSDQQAPLPKAGKPRVTPPASGPTPISAPTPTPTPPAAGAQVPPRAASPQHNNSSSSSNNPPAAQGAPHNQGRPIQNSNQSAPNYSNQGNSQGYANQNNQNQGNQGRGNDQRRQNGNYANSSGNSGANSGGGQGQSGRNQPHYQNRGSNQNQQRGQQNQPNHAPQYQQRTQNRPPAPAGFQIDFEGIDFSNLPMVKRWDELTIVDPQPRLTLEYPGCPASCRLIDLFCPIGRGQRGLIVSPPKAGKTTLLKDIATALLRNHPDLEIVVLLVDERPEEVTDFRRTFAKVDALDAEMASRGNQAALENGLTSVVTPPRQRVRVIASSNDHNTERHIAVSIQTIDRCKRLVEAGKHVVVMLDSITRLGRAFNQSRKHASSGRTMTGGLDSKALEVPRQIFGSARNTEEAGSLTIIGSCLVDTGSQADQIIFEEFKGSGNMELILDRKIAERRMFPAINLAESGTRKEHLLMREDELKTMTALRRRLLSMHPHQQVEQLLAALQRFPTNATLVGSAS